MAATLSRAAFAKASAFIESEGRALDAALFRHAEGQGPADAAVEALAAYQNADGGFGHGLEPDLPTPASTAIATSIGLRLLREIGVDGGHPMVAAAFRWLDGAIDREAGVWPIVTPEVDLTPHAPWWSWSEDMRANWNGCRFNPTAELLAALYHWRDAAPSALLTAAEAGMRRSLADTALIEGAYDLKCAVRLVETAGLPEDMRAELSALIVRSALAHAAGDEHGSALEFAQTPESLLAGPLAARIDPAIEALIAEQEADGGWPLFWDWGFVDAAAWAKAKADWRGFRTRDNLATLVAWGRIEPASA
ncbi:MAG TPA: hypothetical protein VKU90_04190 [Caulobacteraceae bacterium]|jgi:hypothetical protein|nr:hypothetical protein [Caulobacteraceae bacterium]